MRKDVIIKSTEEKFGREEASQESALLFRDEPGFPMVEHLPLLPWELESAGEHRSCKPPEGISDSCCLGSVSAGGGVHQRNDVCNIGMEPYHRAEKKTLEFLQAHPLSALEQQCDICRIVEIMIERNWMVTFQGDSVMRQNFVGLECELFRRGYNVTVRSERSKKERKNWRYGISDRTTLTVQQGEHQATFRGIWVYRPDKDMIEVRTTMQALYEEGVPAASTVLILPPLS
jgi:hypothetical protein